MAAPNTGDLDQHIQIESAPLIRSGSSGQHVRDWENSTVEIRRLAKISATGSRELFKARQIAPETDVVITMHGFHPVTHSMRVKHIQDGRLWDIVGVETLDGKAPQYADWIELRCVEGKRSGS